MKEASRKYEIMQKKGFVKANNRCVRTVKNAYKVCEQKMDEQVEKQVVGFGARDAYAKCFANALMTYGECRAFNKKRWDIGLVKVRDMRIKSFQMKEKAIKKQEAEEMNFSIESAEWADFN